MNKVVLMGRLTRDPEIRYTAGEESKAVAKYTLAVDRRYARREEAQSQTADFISCTAFGKAAEFANKHLRKGTKIAVSGHIQTGSYTDRDGRKVYTTEVIVEEQEFAESKGNGNTNGQNGDANWQQEAAGGQQGDGFMDIPGGAEDEMPFM